MPTSLSSVRWIRQVSRVKYLVVGNEGTNSHNAYQLTNAIRAISPLDNFTAAGSVTLSPAFRFRDTDTTHRMFVVSGPVAYICNAAANARTLRCYERYPITNASPASEAAAQLSGADVIVVADNVTSCRMRCVSGTRSTTAVRVRSRSRSPSAGGGTESIRVFQQSAMDNAR